MKKRVMSLLLCLALAFALLPTAALAATTVNKIVITMTAPKVGEPLPTDAHTASTGSTHVTKVEWTPADGTMRYDTAYSVVFTIEIKPDKDAQFTTKTFNTTVNGKSDGVTTKRVSNSKVTVSYSYAAVKSPETIAREKAEAEYAELMAGRWTLAEAEANRPLNNPLTIVISEDTLDMGEVNAMHQWTGWQFGKRSTACITDKIGNYFHTVDGDLLDNRAEGSNLLKKGDFTYNDFRVTRVIYDLYRQIDFSAAEWPNETEFWLSPKCDIQGILDNIGRDFGEATWRDDSQGFYTYDRILFIPAYLYPNGPTYKGSGTPGCRVMLYDGDDVYAAAAKGASAAHDWCTSHSYTAEIPSPDRLYCTITCWEDTRYYYSCAKCGLCENNPNHTFSYNEWLKKKGAAGFSNNYTAHDYSVRDLSDEHFVGINADGDRVYLLACVYCGKDKRYHDLNETFEEFQKNTGETWEVYQLSMSRSQKSWAEGGSSYNNALKATVARTSNNCFAVASSTYVTATTSGWARNDVNAASVEGLIDKSLLGNNYTANITRLQFASVAVKMAEKMTGKAITPAPSGTFTDTDNEYVRKAYAAGITSGTGDGTTFSPNSTLDRQQMATFLYRALQYVKDNSYTDYSIYDSKLGSYSDAGQIAGWATDSMAFMNALGLVNGSDNKLMPSASCTIEQALLVALRSLDAGELGWYQCVKSTDAKASYGSLVSRSSYGANYCYGDRVFVTALSREINVYGAVTYTYGVCVDPYGYSRRVLLSNFRAIKG